MAIGELPFGFGEAPEVLIEDGRTSDPDQWLDEAARFQAIASTMAQVFLPSWRRELPQLRAKMRRAWELYRSMRSAYHRDMARERFHAHQQGMPSLFGETADDWADDVGDAVNDESLGGVADLALRSFQSARRDWQACRLFIQQGEKLVREAVERRPDRLARWRNSRRGRVKYAPSEGDGEE